MSGAMFFVFILVIAFLIVLFQNVRVVAQAHCYVIERLGRYYGTWNAGIHVKVPFIDKIVVFRSAGSSDADTDGLPVPVNPSYSDPLPETVYLFQ